MEKEKYPSREIDDAQFDLVDESDRGAVIVGAALLEDSLTDLIKSNINIDNLSKKNIKDLFDLSGPISNFSSKSLIALSFGIIEKDVFHDLQIIRSLRNSLAHSHDKADLNAPDFRAKVLSLKCTERAKNYFNDKRYSTENPTQQKEWEIRSDGYIKYTKAVFSIGIKDLNLRMKFYDMERKYKNFGLPIPEQLRIWRNELEIKD